MSSKILTVLKIFISWAIYLLSFILPRSEKVWVFVGWHYNKERELFADNSKYAFLHASQNLPQIKAIWISKNDILPSKLREKGLNSYSIKSFKGIFYSIRAGYTFIDSFMDIDQWKFIGRSKIIQLWHGKGLKKTGHDSPYSLKRYNRIIFPNLFAKYHTLIASSEYTKKLMEGTFKAPLENILISGLPRNDVFFQEIPNSEIDSHEELNKKIKETKSNNIEKIILYAPTFRPDGTNPVENLDLETFNVFLKKRKSHLIISWHPKFAKKDLIDKVSWSNISFISSGYDIYPSLKKIDLLITDYSSLFVDFLLLDKPMIFFTFDLKYYKKEMGLHDEFEKLTPGPHPKNQEELFSAIENSNSLSPKHQEIKNKFFKFDDGNSTQRIIELFLD